MVAFWPGLVVGGTQGQQQTRIPFGNDNKEQERRFPSGMTTKATQTQIPFGNDNKKQKSADPFGMTRRAVIGRVVWRVGGCLVGGRGG